MSSVYESERLLEQYLLFHYGEEQDLMPFSFGPKNGLYFPVSCVTECLEGKNLPKNASALDIGCAVGRSSFELTRYCKKVIGIDNSQSFINAANQILEKGQLEYTITEEGARRGKRVAVRPVINNAHLEFRCEDAMKQVGQYDVVLAANLICRLSQPMVFLESLKHIVKPGGILIITSPYSWLEEFTPRNNWLEKPLDQLQKALGNTFVLDKAFDLPFTIREHYRKYQWGVAQASVWTH
jgi:putative 4-mercaptohistidine N1-methyltranferase